MNDERTKRQGSFIVNAKSINEFLYYWIAQNKKTFLRRASGSTFLEISKQEISKIIIPLPHIEEQKKITNFLTAIDKKIEALLLCTVTNYLSSGQINVTH
ncbi:restriction endonuclease subunit S [Nostoc sp.]|uniref:restriction endonuclease subunit S n=1 Tax=Nostoc sp. TaxID=1180 RepID=UPI003FA60207